MNTSDDNQGRSSKHMVLGAKLDSYEPLHDSEWASNMRELTTGTDIQSTTENLVFALTTSCDTFSVPFYIVKLLAQESPQNFNDVDQLDAVFVQLLLKSVKLKTGQIRAIKKFAAEWRECGKQATKQLLGKMMNFYWDQILNDPEMEPIRYSIVGSLRMVFCAMYFAYEDFLASVIRVRLNLHLDKKIYGGDVGRELNKAFDDKHDYASHFLENEHLKIARLIRNAYSHNGGRVTKELRAEPVASLLNKCFPIMNDEIFLKPENCRDLYSLVTQKSLDLAKLHCSKPEQ